MGAEVKVPSLSFYLQYKVLTHRLSLSLCSHVRPRCSSHVRNLLPRSLSRSSPSATSTNHLRGGEASVWTESWSCPPIGRGVRSLKKKRKRTFCTAEVFSGCFQLSVIILMLSSVFGGWGLLVYKLWCHLLCDIISSTCDVMNKQGTDQDLIWRFLDVEGPKLQKSLSLN